MEKESQTFVEYPMVESVKKPDGRIPRRWLRFPSFKAACALSCSVLAAAIAWTFVDASFESTVHGLLTLIGLGPRWLWKAYMNHWLSLDELGTRIMVLGVLGSLAVVANAIVAIRLVVGRAGGRSILGYLTATAIAGAWLAFFLRYDNLQVTALRYRLARRLPELNLLFEQLHREWPTASGSLPIVGSFQARAVDDVLIVGEAGSWYPWSERFGPFIRRLPSGGIQMNLFVNRKVLSGDPTDWNVEFAPASLPGDFSHTLGPVTVQHTLAGSQELGGSLYLTWYETVYRAPE